MSMDFLAFGISLFTVFCFIYTELFLDHIFIYKFLNRKEREYTEEALQR